MIFIFMNIKKKCYKECPSGTIKFNNNSIINKSYCKPICTEEKPYEIISTQECVKNCPFEYLKNNECIQNYKNNKETEEINKQDLILKTFENYLTSDEYNTSSIDQGKDYIFQNEKMKITLTSPENQNRNKDQNNTIIDIGQCELLLREEYHFPDNETLYIKKIDIYEEGMKIPKIEYDIYSKLNGKNLVRLNISICKDTNINLIIPILLTENIDIYNSSSDYYNNICNIASQNKGIDISLKDRKNEFIEKNKTVCQDDCNFIEYNYSTQKAKCECDFEESSESFIDMKINKTKLYHNFVDVNNIANIKLMICYKELFNISGIKKNIAFYTILFDIYFHIIVTFVFYKYKKSKINKKIKDISFSISHWDLVGEDKIENLIKTKTKKQNKKNKNINHTKSKNKATNKKETKIISSINIETKKNKRKYKHNAPIKKKNKDKIKFSDNNNNTFNLTNLLNQNEYKNMNKEEIVKKSKEIMEYNDEELNNLPYHLALKYDKRSFFEYYISLLKTKHIIIFTFYYNKDYNTRIIKIDLFFISFIIFLTINALFFTDETMHEIYLDQGSFNFIYRLPQIIYSSIISAMFNIPLNLLALSEDNILKLKKNKKKRKFKRKSKKIK